jgi:hypothetical protein
MICPCCGRNRKIDSIECASCGARQVGPPLAPPDLLLPRLGLPGGALACAVLAVFAFLAFWIVGNDLKVGRALLVWVVGDGTEFTKSLLKGDPRLPLYRIFRYDAYKAAVTLSFGLIPVLLFGMWMARRAGRLAAIDPARFGGVRLARASFALTACLFVVFSATVISWIPDALANGRAKRMAATYAKMYEQAESLRKYYREYGAYPQELEDLSRINVDTTPQSDYWENSLAYAPVPADVVASRGAAIIFSGYKLVSAGPDGKLGTADDITMVDGVIVDSKPDPDLPATPEAPRQ